MLGSGSKVIDWWLELISMQILLSALRSCVNSITDQSRAAFMLLVTGDLIEDDNAAAGTTGEIVICDSDKMGPIKIYLENKSSSMGRRQGMSYRTCMLSENCDLWNMWCIMHAKIVANNWGSIIFPCSAWLIKQEGQAHTCCGLQSDGTHVFSMAINLDAYLHSLPLRPVIGSICYFFF